MRSFHHTTIGTEYHALYSECVFTRINASYAEQERQMRECMGNRDNYDMEAVRGVVAHWGSICPNGNAHRVAMAVLAEREAEEAGQYARVLVRYDDADTCVVHAANLSSAEADAIVSELACSSTC